MSAKQIITIDTDGGMSGLQRKPGQGLDLTKFGKASVTRTSEIVWNDERQHRHVQILTGACAGLTLDRKSFEAATGQVPDNAIEDGGSDIQPIGFASYDDGVAAEIAFLDALRLKGII